MQTRAQASPLILSLGLAGFVVMADNWVVSPILPAIAGDIGVTPVRAAVLIAAYMLPFALFQLVFGPLADRYGKLAVLRVAMVGFTVATGLTALGTTVTDLTIFRALTGAFAAAAMPVSFALLGDTVRMEERQSAIGSFMGIAFLGQGLSMGIGGAIAYFVNWRGVFLVYAVLSVAVTILLIRRTRGLALSGNPKSEFVAPYLRLVRSGRSLRTYLVVLFEGALIMGSFSYLGAFLSSQHSLDNLGIGLGTMAFGIAAIVAGRKSGVVASRIGRRQTLVGGLLLAAVGDATIALLGGALPAAILAIALLGVGFMFAHSTLLTIATEFAARARGSAMSLVAFCMMGGGAIGTSIGQRCIEGTSFSNFYGLWAALLLVLASIAFFAVRDTIGAPAMAASVPAVMASRPEIGGGSV
jgi:predicted MFS family arabinose efflux permease